MTKQTTTSKRAQLTLMTAFEQLLEKAEGSKLSSEFFRKAKRLTDYLHSELDISPIQAVFLAVILNGDRDEHVRMSYISHVLGCKNIHMLSLMKDLYALVKSRLLFCSHRSDDYGYRVPNAVVDAWNRNERYTPEPISGLNADELMAKLEEMINERDCMNTTYEMFVIELRELIDANLQLPICSGLKGLALNDDELSLVAFFASKLVNDDDNNIIPSQFSDIFEGRTLSRMRNSFVRHSNPLVKRGIIVPNGKEGIFDGTSWQLSDEVCQKMLCDYNVERDKEVEDTSLLKAEDITCKTLYYNAAERQQVKRLTELLEQQHFDDIRHRLADKGMRTGFNCIFYGTPGTGKTETVLQLARATGRDIMQVDIPKVKSMWVGESEKNVKGIFDRYRRLVEGRKVVPILFFNEADAIFGTRLEDVQRSVDKMENAIQNIILQEMETLDGILIATTNLTVNLDKAFERRFLYKIEFNQPDVAAKRHIWLSMVPELSKEQASELASTYNFSGGQIENIARKKAVDDILSGRDGVDMDAIRDYCQSELLVKGSQTSYVGFKTA